MWFFSQHWLEILPQQNYFPILNNKTLCLISFCEATANALNLFSIYITKTGT